MEVSTEVEGLAERIGWERIGNKTLDEKIYEINKLREMWKMKKTKHGNVFISVGEVKPLKIKNKKTGQVYKRGRIQITVDPEWIGYTAMVTLSKTKTPKFKVYVDEVDLDNLPDLDPADLADIVFESNNGENKTKDFKPQEKLPDWVRREYES